MACKAVISIYPQTPTHPQAEQKSHPSFLITAKFPHSTHFITFIFGADPFAGVSNIPMVCTGMPNSSRMPSMA